MYASSLRTPANSSHCSRSSRLRFKRGVRCIARRRGYMMAHESGEDSSLSSLPHTDARRTTSSPTPSSRTRTCCRTCSERTRTHRLIAT
jgi:hypothetical protein